jgi:hypothetical protein
MKIMHEMDFNLLILGCEFVVFVALLLLFIHPFWTQLIYATIGIFLALLLAALPAFPYTDYRQVRYLVGQLVMGVLILLVLVA